MKISEISKNNQTLKIHSAPPSTPPHFNHLRHFFRQIYIALWPLLYFGIEHHRSVWVSFLWHCFSNFLTTWTCTRLSVFERITNIAMIWYISIPSSESNANVTSSAHQCNFLSKEGKDPSCFSYNWSQISERAIACTRKTEQFKATHLNPIQASLNNSGLWTLVDLNHPRLRSLDLDHSGSWRSDNKNQDSGSDQQQHAIPNRETTKEIALKLFVFSLCPSSSSWHFQIFNKSLFSSPPSRLGLPENSNSFNVFLVTILSSDRIINTSLKLNKHSNLKTTSFPRIGHFPTD